jgi:hypothetical protein
MMVYTCNPSTLEAEEDNQEFEANLGYTARPLFQKLFLKFFN